jgi:hypothetical protein
MIGYTYLLVGLQLFLRGFEFYADLHDIGIGTQIELALGISDRVAKIILQNQGHSPEW